jgi:hypothetical protein
MHGIAKLAISRQLPFGRAAARDFADKAATILLSGMKGVGRESKVAQEKNGK